MTVSGLGISYLPGDCLVEWRNRGLLEEVRVVPELPLVEYAAMLRSDQSSAFLESVVEIASQDLRFFSHVSSRIEPRRKKVHRGFPGKAALIFRKKAESRSQPYA